ncbi:Mu-like prophage major head subunit gpT family protein [Planctomicrobium sp. SH661]|uniref:Mu-like prophage major head subunit gpT family protein n=1 Tax=Planctomicrobium sp. SH661 TaxID=3448124 RepID=UPI003F5B5319
MSLDTASKVARLRGLTAKFDTSVQTATPLYPRMCNVIKSTGSDEQYGMLGSLPGMQEWLSERQFAQVKAAEFTIKNKEWENSIRIEKNHIDDDRIGLYDPVFEQLAAEAAYHADELTVQLIENGTDKECFDGQYFFDTDHVWGDSGSNNNDLTSDITTVASPTEDEFRSAYHKMRAAMLGFKRDNGKPYHRPTVGAMTDLELYVPPGYEEIAVKALQKTLVNQGETNIVLDRPRIVTCTYFTKTDRIYLFRTGQPLKPFVFQARRPLQRQMKGMDDREFKDVKFMCDARYNVGYLAWWNAVTLQFT